MQLVAAGGVKARNFQLLRQYQQAENFNNEQNKNHQYRKQQDRFRGGLPAAGRKKTLHGANLTLYLEMGLGHTQLLLERGQETDTVLRT